MKSTIVFIHGMFLNSKSWEKWVNYFEDKGYKCLTPSWPLHAGEPTELRKNLPEGLGNLSLQTLIDYHTNIVASLPSPPILIGHSMGGLLVQILLNKGLGSHGIVISSVAPNTMLSLDWGMIKIAVSISNPLKGNEPYYMNEEGFHKFFANTMNKEDAYNAFKEFATHDSRNVFRDCMKEPGEIDLDKSHPPLLFIAGEKDEICPPELNKKNYEAYTDKESLKDLKEFPNRSHFIVGEPGWEEVVDYIYNWVEENTFVLQEGSQNRR